MFHVTARWDKTQCPQERALVDLTMKLLCEELLTDCCDGSDDDEYFHSASHGGHFTQKETRMHYNDAKKEAKVMLKKEAKVMLEKQAAPQDPIVEAPCTLEPTLEGVIDWLSTQDNDIVDTVTHTYGSCRGVRRQRIKSLWYNINSLPSTHRQGAIQQLKDLIIEIKRDIEARSVYIGEL